MSWKFAAGLAVFWLLFTAWVWTTNGAVGFVIGAPITAVVFAVVAIVAYKKRADRTDSPHRSHSRI